MFALIVVACWVSDTCSGWLANGWLHDCIGSCSTPF